MNRKCATVILCPGPAPGLFGDSPVSNYTAELPDTLQFDAFTYPIFDTNNALNGTDTTGNFPPWFAAGCEGTCFSFLSADDAAGCAARQAFICAHTPPAGPPPVFFFNTAQSCPFTCPDGTLYVFTVTAGYFVALSQAEADELAQGLACERAIVNHVCLGNLTPGACVNVQYRSTIQLFGVYPLGVSVVSGSLPPGFFMTQDPAGKTATVSGTCSAPGNYTFSRMATDPNGNFHVKSYTIAVLGMTNIGSVPQAVENTAYSFQLNAVGGTGPYAFVLTSGSLPGLTLSSSGLISGTPPYTSATGGIYPFSVTVTDSNGNGCTQNGVLTVKLRPGPDWTQFAWPTFVVVSQDQNHFASGGASQNGGGGTLSMKDNTFLPSIGPVASSNISYTGPSVTMRCRLIINSSQGNFTIAMALWRNGAPFGNIMNQSNVAPGTYDKDTIIPIGAGDTYQAQGGINDIGPNNNQFAILININQVENVNFNFFLFNV